MPAFAVRHHVNNWPGHCPDKSTSIMLHTPLSMQAA